MAGPVAFTREEMAAAYDAGVAAMSRALQGGPEPVNPYRVEEHQPFVTQHAWRAGMFYPACSCGWSEAARNHAAAWERAQKHAAGYAAEDV